MSVAGWKVARYAGTDGRPRLGRVHGEATALDSLRGLRLEPLVGDLLGALEPSGEPWLDAAAVRLLPPLLPSKIVGIGSNYRDHAAEMGRPLPTVPKIFLKPPSAVIGPGEPIRLPPGTERVDHEAELALVIGRHLTQASPAQALDGIAGYTALNDVTARDLQKADGVFARAKGFDSFCPMGPWLVRGPVPPALGVRCHLAEGDGPPRRVQDGNTRDLVFGLVELVVFVSAVMSLWPGDVIATGTPAGVSPLRAGQRVGVEIEGLGVLWNPVQDRPDRRAAAAG